MYIVNPLNPDILTDGERYTLEQKLKKLLVDEDCFIYVQPIINELKPDFIVIGKKFGVLIIEVKDWDDDYIQSANPNYVISKTNKKYRNPISQVNHYSSIVHSKLNGIEEFFDSNGNLIIPISMAIFYVNLSESSIDKHLNLTHENISIYDKRSLRQLSLSELIVNVNNPLSDDEIKAVRGVLFPEITIPNEHLNFNDELSSISNIRALDYEQEEFAKKIPNGHYMVSGIPGSGKTVMLLSRALHLAQRHDQYKILIITYTKALSNKLKHQLNVKLKEMHVTERMLDRIEIKTFHKLCFDLVGKPKHTQERQNEDYYNEFWPKEAIMAVKNNPLYDAVLVDEYQDFHADWFTLCRDICKKNDNNDENLFFAGDRLQRIYDVTWSSYKEIGINIHGGGRSKLLKTPYRTNQNHLDFALQFLSLDDSLSKDINKFYEMNDINNFSMYKNNIDIVNGTTSSLLKYIQKLIVELDIMPEDILILCHRTYEPNEILKMLPSHINSMFVSGKDPIKGKGLITTYHSSKGLEAKYCILFKIDEFEMNKKNRCLLYVGMTRASKKLIVHYAYDKGFAEEITNMLSAAEVV